MIYTIHRSVSSSGIKSGFKMVAEMTPILSPFFPATGVNTTSNSSLSLYPKKIYA